jgi:hypothetical protein
METRRRRHRRGAARPIVILGFFSETQMTFDCLRSRRSSP